MSEQSLRRLPLRILPASMLLARRGALGGRGSAHLIERHARVYRRTWLVLASGFFEPLFYLLSIGVGIGELVGGKVIFDGHAVGYTSFVAPALLATSAMNGAIFDSTFNIFFRLKYAKLYDAALATPMRAGRRGAGRDRLGADPRRPVRLRVHGHHAGARPGALGLGRAGHPGRPADRLRVRRCRDGGHYVHPQLAGLRVRHAGDAADVPVLDDVLPAQRLPAADPADRATARRCIRGSRCSAA